MNHDGFNAQLEVYIEEDEGKDILMDPFGSTIRASYIITYKMDSWHIYVWSISKY
jgi:hypothetical protein